MFTATASPDLVWYRNLESGEFSDDTVASAMWAATIEGLGTGQPIVPVLAEFFNGHFIEGETATEAIQAFDSEWTAQNGSERKMGFGA